MAVMLQTSVGDLVIDLYADDPSQSVCASFTKLASRGYYDGCLVYNVQPNCLAQSGDPTATG